MYTIASHCSAFGKCRTIAYRVKQSGLHCSALFGSVLHLANAAQCRTMAGLLFFFVLHSPNVEQCKTMCRALYSLTFQILQLNACSVTRARRCVSVAACVVVRINQLVTSRHYCPMQCTRIYIIYRQTNKHGERQ